MLVLLCVLYVKLLLYEVNHLARRGFVMVKIVKRMVMHPYTPKGRCNRGT